MNLRISSFVLERTFFSIGLIAIFVFAAGLALAQSIEEEAEDPAQVTIGERLFNETRFSQFFYARSMGNVNSQLSSGDPANDTMETIAGRVESPFRGQASSCATCHMVDQALEIPGGGMRTYADFASRTLITSRDGRETKTLRNTQIIVNSTIPRSLPIFLHHDGEFTSIEDLNTAALTGRNMGWLGNEINIAKKHLVKVVKEDDGQGDLAQEFGGSYRDVLAGRATKSKFKLPKEYQVDVMKASDDEIINTLSKIMAAYMDNLRFAQDDEGHYSGSPFDAFLIKNALPRKPSEGESDMSFNLRLKTSLENLSNPLFVNSTEGNFKSHSQDYVFGPKELEGLLIFMNESVTQNRGAGACFQCHTAPHFTNFAFHNIGVAQEEYDSAHGFGSFMNLKIPSLAERNISRADDQARFRSQVSANDPNLVDLGLWNNFAHPSTQKNQKAYREVLEFVLADALGNAREDRATYSDAELLPLTIGMIKTPTLRDLGHSAPYFHNGQAASIEEAVAFYIRNGQMARMGKIRNADPRLARVQITPRDIAPLSAFLRSLNEDYE